MLVPDNSMFKDLNSTCKIPPIVKAGVLRYLQVQNKDSIEDSAIQMYHEQFMQYIRCACEDSKCYIHASVRAEMSKNVQYIVNILLADDGEVLQCQCECPVGAWPTAHCKHVMVTLLGLVEFGREGNVNVVSTCTEVLQTFHHPRGKYKGSPIKSCNLPFKKHRAEIGESSHAVTSQFSFETRGKDKIDRKGYGDYVNNLITNYAAQHTEEENRIPFMQLIKPANTYAVESDHDYMTFTQSQQMLKDMHITETTQEYVAEIEQRTEGQSKSQLWHKERSIRITASVMGSVCKATAKRDMAKLAKSIVCPRKFTSRATAHGQAYEEEALALYALLTDNKVEPSGLIVDISKPYLGGSPDGLCDDRVIEVKCPYSAKFSRITPVTVPYLYYDSDNKLKLKTTSDYFYQVMGLMHITNKPQCDFVVFTLVDIAVINIQRDDEFIKTMVTKLDAFFITHLKPCILEHYLYKNFNMYKSFYSQQL